VILDVGHNQDGMAQIKEQLEFSKFEHLHIIIGMVKDKEIDPVMQLLPSYAKYYFTKAQIPRALDESSLQQIGSKYGLNGHQFPDVNTALQDAISKATNKDLILVCGSVFLVGEVTDHFIY
jgi:dihydrofolate synthase/folylpolyglutamate synthase